MNEDGGINLYAIINNDSLNSFDVLGNLDVIALKNKYKTEYKQSNKKQCGTIVTRPLEGNLIGTTFLHFLGFDHYLYQFSDDSIIDFAGSGQIGNNILTNYYPVMIPCEMTCDEFSNCIRQNWPVDSTYLWIINDCRAVALRTITNCGGEVDDFLLR